MIAAAPDFPETAPEGYEPLEREPEFVASRHLALEPPRGRLSLAELGYDDESIAACPSTLAITDPFRLLSDEGVACLQDVATLLEPFATANARISRNVRGGVYRSRFLRDLCRAPEVTSFMAGLAGAPLAPHSMPHQLGHLNYQPRRLGEHVDKWHVDTLRIDYVLYVSDPREVEGGAFEFFRGTREEVAALVAAGKPLPAGRIVAPAIPGAGHAVAMQGNMVVHRGRALTRPGRRVTMVNGYVPTDLRLPDYCRYDQLCLADPAHVVTPEYERHVAWRVRERAREILAATVFSDDRDGAATRLEALAREIAAAAGAIRDADNARMEHFGDG